MIWEYILQYKSYSCIFIALCIINQHKYVSNVLRPGFHHHKNPLYGFQKYSIYLAHLGLFFLHRFGFFVLFFQSNPADSVHELFSAQSLTAHLHMSKLSAVFLCQDTHWSTALITATAACPSVQTVRTHTQVPTGDSHYKKWNLDYSTSLISLRLQWCRRGWDAGRRMS